MISIFEKSKTLSLGEMERLLYAALPMISTTMTTRELTNYLTELFPVISGATMQTLRIPASGTYSDMMISGVGASLVPDLDINRQLLVETLMPK